MIKFENSMSVGRLAAYIGIPRQRLYNLIKDEKRMPISLRPDTIGKTYVFSPEKAALIVDAVIRVRTKTKMRIVFDFI